MRTIFLLLTILLTSCESDIRKAMEQSYFEGQKDALNNDVRIKRNHDSCWIWIDSPWNNGRQPIFDPSFKCN